MRRKGGLTQHSFARSAARRGERHRTAKRSCAPQDLKVLSVLPGKVGEASEALLWRGLKDGTGNR